MGVEHQFQVLENEVLRKISWPKEDEVNNLGWYNNDEFNYMIYTRQ
jgi:hypothetical protein